MAEEDNQNRQGKIEQRAKTGYLISSFDQPQNQSPNTDLLELSSKNQPNPSLGCGKGEVRGTSNSASPCSHCKRRGHVMERCWFLHPHLKPDKEKGGGRGVVEKRSENCDLREGEETRSDSMKQRLDKIEDQLLTFLSASLRESSSLHSKGPNEHLFYGGELGETHEPKNNCINGPKISTDFSFRNSEPKIMRDLNLERLIENKCLTIGFTTINAPNNCTKWVLDSGATDHMTGDQTLLKNYCPINGDQYFTVANNEKIKIKGWGMISIFFKKISSRCVSC